MKKNIGRVLAFLWMWLFLVQPIGGFAEGDAVEPAVQAEQTDLAAGLLHSLGIVDDLSSDSSDVGMTKGEFLTYTLNLIRCSVIPAEEQLFFDVPLTSVYADVIHTAYGNGLITGDEFGNAGAAKPVTWDEAAVIAVRALKCTAMLPNSGDMMSDYRQAAAKLGLFDRLAYAGEQAMTREEAYTLLFNALNAELIETNDGINYKRTTTTLLKSMYDVAKTGGLVENCSYGDIYGGEPQRVGFVVIDGVSYRCEDKMAREFLGMDVTLYYRDTDAKDKTAVYICRRSGGVLELSADDMDWHKQGEINYHTSTRQRSVRLSSSAITLINGTRVSVPSAGLEIPKYGKVRLIENDNDGQYDVIVYTAYELAVVSGVNVNDNKIYTRQGSYKVIDLEAYERYEIFGSNGEKLALSDMTKDAVLNIYAGADKRWLELVVATDAVSCTVTALRTVTEGSRSYLVLESETGDRYRTVSDFYSVSEDNAGLGEKKSGALGRAYRLALNTDGRVAAVLKWSGGAEQYGYFIAVAETGKFDRFCARLLTEDGQVETINIADKVRVTVGETTAALKASEFAERYGAEGVVRYYRNDAGELAAVEVSQAEGTEGLRAGAVLPAGSSVSTRYISSVGLLGGRIAVNDSTRVFFLPPAEHIGDAQWYSADTGKCLKNENYYPSVKSYYYDSDIYADVIVMSSITATSKRNSVMLVEDRIIQYNAETGETKDGLSGLIGGNSMSYTLSNDPNISRRVSGYKPDAGDLIRFVTDESGDIVSLDPIFDYSERKIYNFQNSSTERYVFGDNVCQLYGQMLEIHDGAYMRLKRESGTPTDACLYPVMSSTVFCRYASGREKNRLSVIEAGEVPTQKNEPDSSARVVVITTDYVVSLVVVYE